VRRFAIKILPHLISY